MSASHPAPGSDRDDPWCVFARSLRGNVLAGTLLRSERVLVAVGAWTVVVDGVFSAATKSIDTRVRAPFVNPSRLRFAVHRRGLLSDLAVRMGMQDIVVGHEPFDRSFVVRASDEAAVRALLDDARVRQLLEAQPTGRLAVQDADRAFQPREPGSGGCVDELCFTIRGRLAGAARLRDAAELLGQSLDRLTRMGFATGESPAATSCLSCGHPLLRQPICPECGKPVTGRRLDDGA